MNEWTVDELKRIGKADELEIASLRRDETLRKAVTIWVVRVGEALYVRAVNGRKGVWYRHAQERLAGHISAGGVEKHVTFEQVSENADLNQRIDAAYAAKYKYSRSAVRSVTSEAARAATLRLVPR